MQHNNDLGYASLQQPGDATSAVTSQTFLVWSILSKIAGATLVQVKGVTNSGGLSPVGTVDIQPMVNQIDGNWNAVPHGVIYKCPYMRVQGGTDAIILDPKVGDIGIAIFADRDISSVIATKKQANPGSRRIFDMADGLYIGGVLNGVPSQYVQFSTAGIKIHSPTAVILDAPDVQITGATVEITATTSTTVSTPTFTVNGATVMNGTISQIGGGASTFSGSINTTGSITSQGTVLHTHTHGGVTTGSGTTGAPT